MAKINLTLTQVEQDAICLECPLDDCVDIESKDCPIQVEQRRIWREKHQQRKIIALRSNDADLPCLLGASQRWEE